MEGLNLKEKSECRVCVTGGSGYIGSWLVKKLLEKGYTVHATLRNLDDESKVGLLKGFPGAEARLLLFKADIYKPDEFDSAIHGCTYVFHVATLFHQPHDNEAYKKTVEAAVAGTRSIAMSCSRSGSVRRLIYTASVVSASPIKEDKSGFKDFMDESCWTPLDWVPPYSNYFFKAYQDSKTLAEKEILSLGKENAGGSMEVVTLACGLVGGDTVKWFTADSTKVIVSQLTNNQAYNNSLNYLEALIGKIPIVHIDDVCEAHIFCMENSSIHGRVLCASSLISSSEIATYYNAQHYPHFHVKQQYLEGPSRKIEWASRKLTDMGFVYKYDTKMILDDSVSCAKRFGDLQQ
ncbi:NADPH HC-toxin reductase 1-like [Humulus lupulus]|uniref:NADPH HC-toxin reductase 1-like n=1 Tax=Humulus lupulus TaxID=3486 RepID=UPI002B410F1C|nr:NADPH HC-toxin reductase 1-like [Humulus lupulus]